MFKIKLSLIDRRRHHVNDEEKKGFWFVKKKKSPRQASNLRCVDSEAVDVSTRPTDGQRCAWILAIIYSSVIPHRSQRVR